MENIYRIGEIFFLFSEFFCWLALQFLFSDRPDFVFHTKIHSIRLGANGIGGGKNVLHISLVRSRKVANVDKGVSEEI